MSDVNPMSDKRVKTTGPKRAAKAAAVKSAAKPAALKPELLKVEAPAPAAAAAPVPEIQGKVETMTDTVRNTAAEATDRAQAIFGEINERAKAAVEKGAKLVEELNELNKGNIEAVVESSKRAAKGAEALGQNAAEFARASFERSTAAMKGFAAVKSPTEFFQLQNDFVRSAFDSVIAETSKNSEAALKIAGDVFQPISNRFAVAAEKLKSAA